jgi:hypothetical protein
MLAALVEQSVMRYLISIVMHDHGPLLLAWLGFFVLFPLLPGLVTLLVTRDGGQPRASVRRHPLVLMLIWATCLGLAAVDLSAGRRLAAQVEASRELNEISVPLTWKQLVGECQPGRDPGAAPFSFDMDCPYQAHVDPAAREALARSLSASGFQVSPTGDEFPKTKKYLARFGLEHRQLWVAWKRRWVMGFDTAYDTYTYVLAASDSDALWVVDSRDQ